MKKIRMGVIGLGGISHVHLSGTVNSPDAELVAVCDIREEMLKEKGDMYNVPETHRFNDHIKLLECPDVDAVSICTPNDSHHRLAMDAIKYKKPFALEKPVTLNYQEAKEIREAAEENNIPNIVCFSYRYKAAARYARHIIQRGDLGKIYHVYGQYLQGWGIKEDVPLVWRFKKAASGSGALGDLGSHMIDLTRFMVGDFKKVCGHAGTFITSRKERNSDNYGNVDVDDYCHYMAELGDGISGNFCISRYGYGRGNYQRVEVYGSKGALVYNLEHHDTLQVCIGDVYKEVNDFREIGVPGWNKADQMQSFFNMINGKGDDRTATIVDGAASQLVLDSVIESFEQEKWVYLKGEGK